jgi:hypothetical protein
MRNPYMISKGIFNGPRSTSKMNTRFLFSFFQNLEDSYEKIKAEVSTKEVICKEYIQELMVKPSMEYSHYTAFVHKFVISMENFKKCNLALDVKKAQIFNSRE